MAIILFFFLCSLTINFLLGWRVTQLQGKLDNLAAVKIPAKIVHTGRQCATLQTLDGEVVDSYVYTYPISEFEATDYLSKKWKSHYLLLGVINAFDYERGERVTKNAEPYNFMQTG